MKDNSSTEIVLTSEMIKNIKLIQKYLDIVKLANKEAAKKEAFKDLLNRLYSGSEDITRVIDQFTLGAEFTILNIPRKNNKLGKGRADTLYNKVIIEFENDLKKTNKHAQEQLAEYLLGQFKSGEGYNFILIATDLITWEIYAPSLECIDKLDSLEAHELVLSKNEKSSITLNGKNNEDFYYWIDRFLFKEEKLRATLKRIEEAFGQQSPVFIESFRILKKEFNKAKSQSAIQVTFEQWNKFLSVAYGNFEANEDTFLIHTYLSVFSKMLAYAILSNDDYIDDNEMIGILDGSIFYSYNISNFVDSHDFYHWVKTDGTIIQLKGALRSIAQEISTFDYTNIDEDVLKGIYQELINIETRHKLGEYYTPDWLCKRILNEFSFLPSDKILDPACGSGSFLGAIVKKIKEDCPNITPDEINEMVYGIDIHPLSVQISKTTLILALGKNITDSKNLIHLNVALANTLLIPKGVKNIWSNQFVIPIDNVRYTLDTDIFLDVKLFDEAIDLCEEIADRTLNKENIDINVFSKNLEKRSINEKINEEVVNSFYEIYRAFKIAKETGRDSIWKFIVQNLYKPYFLAKKFNYVIGNPPWLTYSSITNSDYQDNLDKLAIEYGIKPTKSKDYPHLEIAAIFLAFCNNFFLKPEGKLAFVLPRSFFNGSQHDNSRSGAAKGFKLLAAWDLFDVSPLFRIPSCVFFTESTEISRKISQTGIPGIKFTGNLPSNNCSFEVAQEKITESPITWYYQKLGKATALSSEYINYTKIENPYKLKFKQGATIVPRSFYFAELDQSKPADFENRRLVIKTSQSALTEAKKPWNDIILRDLIESCFIYITTLSKNILPFGICGTEMIVLPILIEKNTIFNYKKIKLYNSSMLLKEGYTDASRWFENVEHLWEERKTERSKTMTNLKRIDFQRGLSEQNLNAPYLVLYNSSAKDANASVVRREDLTFEFIAESVTYVFYTTIEAEAYYLAGILNSRIPNKRIKSFQPKGLFGARHVHKKILDVYFPKFDCNNILHQEISNISYEAHEAAKQYINQIVKGDKIAGVQLGRIRLDLRKFLDIYISNIDSLVEKII